jgi:hypothetical protein
MPLYFWLQKASPKMRKLPTFRRAATGSLARDDGKATAALYRRGAEHCGGTAGEQLSQLRGAGHVLRGRGLFTGTRSGTSTVYENSNRLQI